jgi:hypothetical protein
MSANTLHQPVSGADVEVSPTRNLRNVCHVFDHGTQEEDGAVCEDIMNFLFAAASPRESMRAVLALRPRSGGRVFTSRRVCAGPLMRLLGIRYHVAAACQGRT